MIVKKGKYVRINTKKPEAVGVCDRSGFVFNYRDLVKQYEWRGNRLTWTGIYVGRPFLSKPNPSLRPVPSNLDDPKAVKHARPPENYIPPGSLEDANFQDTRDALKNLNFNTPKNYVEYIE